MKRTHMILVACIVAVLAVCSAAAADPPDRVGRLNFIAGGVSFQPADTSGWASATLNYPLTAGDSLWTDGASRAEVHVGSTAIRLGPASELSFLELDDRSVQISLPRGLLNVRLRQQDPGESFQIDTPTMSVLILGPGSYRVEVREWGDTQATVNEGAMQALVEGQSYSIRARQSAFVAQSDWLSLELDRAPAADEWDRWCAGRDSREDRLASVRYVPRSMVGCEDLDWYGNWNETSEYGPVWIPSSLPAGWAPYKFGRWACGCSPGAGPGSTTSRGGSPPSTTAAGPFSAASGSGCRVRSCTGPCTRRRWWPSSEPATAVRFVMETSGGSLWGRGRRTSRPIRPAGSTSGR